MPNCKDMTELLSTSLESRLPLSKRLAMRLHLLICSTCRRYRQHLLFIQKAFLRFEQSAEGVKLPEAAKQRIKEKLKNPEGQ